MIQEIHHVHSQNFITSELSSSEDTKFSLSMTDAQTTKTRWWSFLSQLQRKFLRLSDKQQNQGYSKCKNRVKDALIWETQGIKEVSSDCRCFLCVSQWMCSASMLVVLWRYLPFLKSYFSSSCFNFHSTASWNVWISHAKFNVERCAFAKLVLLIGHNFDT